MIAILPRPSRLHPRGLTEEQHEALDAARAAYDAAAVVLVADFLQRLDAIGENAGATPEARGFATGQADGLREMSGHTEPEQCGRWVAEVAGLLGDVGFTAYGVGDAFRGAATAAGMSIP